MSTGQTDPPLDDNGVPVGVALAQLRKQARITGQRLGARIGMSQAKISKIETGRTNPSPGDVRVMARALGADRSTIARLVERATSTQDQMMDWRHSGRSPAEWQRQIGLLEAGAQVFRHFSFGVFSGLLQTSEYARRILAANREWSDAPDVTAGVASAVAARLARQTVLDDEAKRFHFVIPEQLLHNSYAPVEDVEDMLAQLNWLRKLSQKDNVTISLIPDEGPWPFAPLHAFLLLDDRHVIIDLYNTTVVSRGQSDLRLYRRAFDLLEACATTDIEPILDECRRRYLDRARGHAG